MQTWRRDVDRRRARIAWFYAREPREGGAQREGTRQNVRTKGETRKSVSECWVEGTVGENWGLANGRKRARVRVFVFVFVDGSESTRYLRWITRGVLFRVLSRNLVSIVIPVSLAPNEAFLVFTYDRNCYSDRVRNVLELFRFNRPATIRNSSILALESDRGRR